MTVQQVINGALIETTEFVDGFPMIEPVMIRRIGIRQQQIFALLAAKVPDFAVVCASAALDTGAANLTDLYQGRHATLPPLERVTRLEVLHPGTSGLSVGQRIALVTTQDLDAEDPPRAVYRNGILRGVRNDLLNVYSVLIYYARKPRRVLAVTDTLDIPSPHTEILVMDLAKELCVKATVLDGQDRSGAIEYFGARETEAVEAYIAHAEGLGMETVRFFDTEV